MDRNFRGIWIPAELWLNRELSAQEKLFLVEIDSLDRDERRCFASNKYFAKFFNLSTSRVSEIIVALEKKGLIGREDIKQGKQTISRHLFLLRRLDLSPPDFSDDSGYPENRIGCPENREGGVRNSGRGYPENAEEITLIDNTSIDTVEEVVNFLNSETDSSFKKTTNKTRTLIRARLADGFTLDDFYAVIRYKSMEWRGTEHDKYLRPETLFGTKFEGYLQAAQRAPVLVPDQINVDGFTVQREPGTSMEGNFRRLVAKTHELDKWLTEREQMGLVNVYPKIYEHVWQMIGKEA